MHLTAQPTKHARIMVAMSGGVDSSVAAAILREQGHEVFGVTMHLWDATGESKVGRCCAPEDRGDARLTCEQLDVPHYVVDERMAFRKHVVDPLVSDYLEGRTPAPCVRCNRTVKLKRLIALADELGATHVATGHYARIRRNAEGHTRLLCGADPNKDQSYFLFGLAPEDLERLLFPLGELVKQQTREEARRLALHNADKPDSQELCFIPDGRVGDFVARERGPQPTGSIKDQSGNVLGKHSGVANYTVGQRRGLGGGHDSPRYVLSILPDSNTVVVGDEQSLLGRELRAADASWLTGVPPAPFEASIRIRHRHLPARAHVTPTKDGFRAIFKEPQRAITPGQAAVVYQQDEVIGGGFIV